MGRRRAAKIGLLVVIAAAIAAIYFSPLRDYLSRDEIRKAAEHLRGYWYGPLVFIALSAISCIFAVPASIFVLAAGAIWGWFMGGIYAIAGAMIGATLSFLAGRFMGEGLIDRFGKAGQYVAKQVDHAGFKSLLVLRCIPGIPFAVLNYGAGVARVKLSDFVLATFVGCSPSTFVFAYCADALINGSMSEGEAVQRLIIVAILMISIIVIPGMLRKRLQRSTNTP